MFIRGVIIALVFLWGGSYLIHIAPKWAEFPALMTTVYGCVFGIALAVYGLGELRDGASK